MWQELLKTSRRNVLRLVVITGLAGSLAGATITANFDSFADGTAITSQISGMQFTNATVLTAGVSLNELEFPPHSGDNVVIDHDGPLSIRFDSPVSFFSVYATYSVPLSFQAFDLNNNLLASTTSRFRSNLALSGDPGSSPNEVLQTPFVVPMDISRLIITGNPAGNSFVIDDITVTTAVESVPEPTSLGSVAIAFCSLTALAHRRSNRSETSETLRR